MKASPSVDYLFENSHDFSSMSLDQVMGQMGWQMVRQRAEMIIFLHHLSLPPEYIAEIVRGFAGMQRDVMDRVYQGLGGTDPTIPRWKHPDETTLNAEIKSLMGVRSLEAEVIDELHGSKSPNVNEGYDRYADECETATLPMLDANGKPYAHFIDVLSQLSNASIKKYLELLSRPQKRPQADV